jgi:hypothetical protein
LSYRPINGRNRGPVPAPKGEDVGWGWRVGQIFGLAGRRIARGSLLRAEFPDILSGPAVAWRAIIDA